MTAPGVTLWLDVDQWREHQRTVAGSTSGLVPVAKGNGYGFGLSRLAGEANLLGVDTIAVGTAEEVDSVRDHFGGDIVILTPWRPHHDLATKLASDPQIITTVSRVVDLEQLANLATPAPGDGTPRVLIEVLTSMRRHGILPDDLGGVVHALDRVQCEGWTIHLPILDEGRYLEAERLARAALDVAPGPLWLSHLPPEEASALARQLGGADGDPVPVRQRVGTRLWLGDTGSRRATATVLDVHKVSRGERVGYRQRAARADGWIVVVAGGTSHGIGMEAPTSASNMRQRAISLATGSLEAAGRALSPYTIAGRKRWFLEPPHMQSSMIFLPSKEEPPIIGTEVPVELRLTTVTVDHILPNRRG